VQNLRWSPPSGNPVISFSADPGAALGRLVVVDTQYGPAPDGDGSVEITTTAVLRNLTLTDLEDLRDCLAILTATIRRRQRLLDD
jgi:hypothetical protein